MCSHIFSSSAMCDRRERIEGEIEHYTCIYDEVGRPTTTISPQQCDLGRPKIPNFLGGHVPRPPIAE